MEIRPEFPTADAEGPAKPAVTRRRALALGLGGAAALATTSPAWAVTDQRPGAVRPPKLGAHDRLVAGRVSARRALHHLRHLSEKIGPRIGGTSSERTAAKYLAENSTTSATGRPCSHSLSPTSSSVSSAPVPACPTT